ncbi:hypothetical protein GCM10010174_45490 [Kutzneria viridogrisea]
MTAHCGAGGLSTNLIARHSEDKTVWGNIVSQDIYVKQVQQERRQAAAIERQARKPRAKQRWWLRRGSGN